MSRQSMVFLTVFAGDDTCEGYECASAVTKCWVTLDFNVPSYDRNNQVFPGEVVMWLGHLCPEPATGGYCHGATVVNSEEFVPLSQSVVILYPDNTQKR